MDSNDAQNSGENPGARFSTKKAQLRIAAVVAIAVVAGVGIWLGVRDTGTSTPTTTIPTATAAASATSRSNLVSLSTSTRRPIYWAGVQTDITYEISQAADGRVWVRYLPKSASPGTTKPYLTIGTYPVRSASAATARIAAQAGSVPVTVKGAVAFYKKSTPTNVYLAFTGTDYQIEVYDPDAKAALQLVTGGAIVPVQTASVDYQLPALQTTTTTSTNAAGATITTTTTTLAPTPGITAAALSRNVAVSGKPIYWAGKQAAGLYELTHVGDREYVRYLPAGLKSAAAGAPYRTIGTYALKGAYTTTVKAAQASGVTTIPVKNGIAFYSAARPNNVFVAFKGVDYQIEVYDPNAAAAHKLVAAGRIVPVP